MDPLLWKPFYCSGRSVDQREEAWVVGFGCGCWTVCGPGGEELYCIPKMHSAATSGLHGPLATAPSPEGFEPSKACWSRSIAVVVWAFSAYFLYSTDLRGGHSLPPVTNIIIFVLPTVVRCSQRCLICNTRKDGLMKELAFNESPDLLKPRLRNPAWNHSSKYILKF